MLFLANVNAEDNEQFQIYTCVYFFKNQIYNFIYVHSRKFFLNLLETTRMQVFPSKLQYHKVLSDFIKKKSVKADEFCIMSNSTLRYTL